MIDRDEQTWQTMEELMEWLEASPPWVQVPAQELGAQIRALQAARSEPAAEAPEPASAPTESWREKIWTVHPDTRLRRDEVCEALGKSTSWLYKKTSAREIPCRLDGESGELVFRAGDLRTWIRAQEVLIAEAEEEALALQVA